MLGNSFGSAETVGPMAADETRITRALTGSPLRVLNNKWIEHYDKHPEEIKPGMQSAISLKQGCWQSGFRSLALPRSTNMPLLTSNSFVPD